MASILSLLPEHLTVYEVWLTRLFVSPPCAYLALAI